MTRSALELYRIGRAHVNAGRHAAARTVLALASTRTDDPDLQARIAGALAVVVIRQGDPEAAERLCRDALERAGLSSHTEAFLKGQLGLVALERGELDTAIALLDQAIPGIGDEADQRAPMLLNRSVAFMQVGRLSEARADLERAAPDYAATGNAVEQAMAVHNAGYVALLEGDIVHALEAMEQAHAALAGASAVNAAICDLDRAEVFRDAGLPTDAERSLERVAGVFGAHRMRKARGEAEFHLARSLLSHAPERASGVAATAARRFRRIGSDSWAWRADAVRLRADLSAFPNGERVAEPGKIPSADQVDRVATELDRYRLAGEAAALRMTLELWAARHAPGQDRQPLVIRPPASASMEVRLLAHTVRAERAASRGRQAEARRHAAQGLDTLASWQRDFGSLDLQTSIAMHGGDLVFAGLASAVRSGRPDIIFEWSERARHLSLQVVPLRPPPDPSLAAELAELRIIRAERGADWLADPRAAALQQHARERQWSETGSSAFEQRVSLDELQISLDSGTALISYVYFGGGLIALVVTEERASVIPISGWPDVQRAVPGLRADLDMLASVRAGPLADVVRRSSDDRLLTLSTALLDGPTRIAGDRRLVITVPGILNGIPWSMLAGMQGRPFTLATSASRWVRQRDDSSSWPSRVAGFAVGPRVTRGEEEATLGASAWRSAQIITGATVDDVANLAAHVDVLHIAAHGRHAVDNPMFSGLELEDGALFGYDIDRIMPVPSTVVLSACEAGRSSVRWGEEAVGMTRIWLHAGTRCVIAAPVIVADDDACDLLAAMHQGLSSGLMPSEALAAASRETGIVAPFQAHGAGF